MVDAAPTAEMGFVGRIIGIVATISFFLPILGKTQATRGAGLSGEEITALLIQFKTWNWGRWAVLIAGWVAEPRPGPRSSHMPIATDKMFALRGARYYVLRVPRLTPNHPQTYGAEESHSKAVHPRVRRR